MIEVELSSYAEVKARLEQYQLCRGTKTSFLLPKLITCKFSTCNDFEKVEDEMNNIFKWQFPDLVVAADDNQRNWEYRIIAREHGLFNRFTDWTNDLTTAVDFATSKPDEVIDEYIFLWGLNYNGIRVTRGDLRQHDFSTLNTTLLINGTIYDERGRRLDQHRQFIQGGFFLVQPSSLLTEPINTQPIFINDLIKIKIPAAKLTDIREEMINVESSIDFTKSIMFSLSDCIDDFCNRLNEQYLK